MMRMTIIALAAGAALATAFAPTAALARGGSHGGMHGGPSMHSGPMMHTGPHMMHMSAFRDHDRFMRFHHDRDHHRFGRFRDRDHDRDFRHRHRFAFIGSSYLYDTYDDGCYQSRLVRTSFGLRWRQVYVCY
jgi:hypothetical protein